MHYFTLYFVVHVTPTFSSLLFIIHPWTHGRSVLVIAGAASSNSNTAAAAAAKKTVKPKAEYLVADLPGVPADVKLAPQYAGYIPVAGAVNGTIERGRGENNLHHDFHCFELKFKPPYRSYRHDGRWSPVLLDARVSVFS